MTSISSFSNAMPQKQVTFKGKQESFENKPRIFPCAASVIIPGTGQFMKGENIKGLAHLGTNMACGITYLKTNNSTIKSIAAIGALVVNIFSAVDAYKPKKAE